MAEAHFLLWQHKTITEGQHYKPFIIGFYLKEHDDGKKILNLNLSLPLRTLRYSTR